jgi:hypothetical protein
MNYSRDALEIVLGDRRTPQEFEVARKRSIQGLSHVRSQRSIEAGYSATCDKCGKPASVVQSRIERCGGMTAYPFVSLCKQCEG